MAPVEMIADFEEFGGPDGTIRAVLDRLSAPERESVGRYLEGGLLISAVPGSTRDVIDGEPVPTPPSLRTDGRYVWRSDLVHYVRKYGVGLPSEFLNLVRSGVPPDRLDPETEQALTDWLRSRFGRV